MLYDCVTHLYFGRTFFWEHEFILNLHIISVYIAEEN